MILSLNKSPFSSHDNILFGFIRRFLVDNNIYSDSGYPFTKLATKYQIKLSECEESVEIYLNDALYLTFDGSVGNSDFLFYVLPVFHKNEIKVKDLSGNLKAIFQFNCYNFNIFLAEFTRQFKIIWNKLYQAQANLFYDDNKVQDLDGNYLTPEYRYTQAIAKLLATERYSKLSNSEYYTFLHNVFDMHVSGGVADGIYQIQQALPSYIDRIDLIPIEKYIPFKNELYGKVFYDSSNHQNIKIYPTYLYQNNEWGLINYNNTKPVSVKLNGYIYVDGELDTTANTGSLKIKYSEDPEFFKSESVVVDSFTNDDIYNDEDGFYTGFEDGKFVILRKPVVDGTIVITNSGTINISNSAYLTEDGYNLVSLGTTYKDEITGIDATYKTFDIPTILGQIELDTTSLRRIVKIKMSGHSDTDASYLGYKENNYGSVVIVLRAIHKLDEELKGIINNLIRSVLPIHIRYYLIVSTINVWDNWGQENFTFTQYFDATTGAFPEIIFSDLK